MTMTSSFEATGLHAAGAGQSAAPRPARARSRRIALAIALGALLLVLNALSVINGWSPFEIPNETWIAR